MQMIDALSDQDLYHLVGTIIHELTQKDTGGKVQKLTPLLLSSYCHARQIFPPLKNQNHFVQKKTT